jgi:hypothetical protein
MSEHDAARFLAGRRFDAPPQMTADAAEPQRFVVEINRLFADFDRAFGDDDIRKTRAGFFARELFEYRIERKRNFGNQNHVGAAGKPGVQRDPAVFLPITSRIITRSCEAAVVCRRSSASVAMSIAVIKPNVNSVADKSLSIVFGTPMTGKPRL